MGFHAFLTNLFGFSPKPKPAKHDLSEIRSVSITCGHMDYSYCYSFRIHREQDKWLFDTKCFTHEHESETVFENREVSREEVDTLFEILDHSDSISHAENYKSPMKSPFIVMDETTYSFCLTFSDKSRYMTRDQSIELESFFYRLAEDTV